MMTTTKSLLTLGALTLALSAAPLFAQQPDANSPSTGSASSQSQQPAQQPANPPSSQQPGQTDPNSPNSATPPAGQSGSDASAQSSADGQSFSGTVAKSGDKFVLQEASGKTYDVDRQEELKKYEGKQVRIKGTLDPDGKTIHVK
jgi:heat shock protein HslJ